MKPREIYVTCYCDKPFMAFTHLEDAINWLKVARGAEQIEGLKFTKDFTIMPVSLMAKHN